mmetsp:Transcript_25283/g.60025  ORF Transcript_25283/g.60025 Transcript_25283/m.60025 type:complete len:266 (+) Transcript_25283:1040-1837(+)
MMAHHEHVNVLVDRVHRVGARGVGRRRDHVRLLADRDDVRRVTTAGPLGVVGVDGPPLEARHRLLQARRLVQRVRVDRDLDVELLGHVEARVDSRRRAAPVLVQLQPAASRLDHLDEALWLARVPFPREPEVERKVVRGLEHHFGVPLAVGAGSGVGTRGGARASAEHGSHSRCDRLVRLLGADVVDVGVDASCCDDGVLRRDALRARADDHAVRYAVHHVRVAGLADSVDFAVLDADVTLVDAGIVNHKGVGEHAVEALLRRIT